MNVSRSTPFIVLAACLAVLGCNKESSSKSAGKNAALAPDTVVARVHGKPITLAELDAHASDELHKFREQQLNQMIIEQLAREEAQKRGITEDQLFQQAVPAPSDEEIKKFYDDLSARNPGQPLPPLEQLKQRIAQAIQQQKGQEFVEKLRKDANVEITLPEAPRQRKQVEAKGPARGPDGAKVTIVEFSDFECPFCGKAYQTVEDLMKDYAGKVRLVFRQFPLPMHPHAEKAAEASLCAQEQGKFWEYYDTLFKNQRALDVQQLKDYAKSLGLDAGKFDQCLDSNKVVDIVKQDQAAGGRVGVNGTPAFFINGVFINGAVPKEELKKVIDEELAGS